MPSVRVIDAAEALKSKEWTDAMPNAFHHAAYLAAASPHGPGAGKALCLEADAGGGEPARWGVVERSKLGLRGAVAWDVPVIPRDADRARAWSALLDALAERGNAVLRMNCVSTLRWSAEETALVVDLANDRSWPTARAAFGTFVVDLSRPEEERLKSMQESHRRKVKSASKHGLRLEALSPERVDEYVAVSDATFARQGREGPTREYLAGLASVRSRFRFYVARDAEGVAQAAAVVAFSKDRAFYLHGGSGNRPVKGAGNWLQWEIMRALASEGVREYDFGGVDLKPVHEQSDGIRSFKEHFGGRFEEHASLDVEFDTLKSRLIASGRAIAARLAGA